MSQELLIWSDKTEIQAVKEMYGSELTDIEFKLFCKIGQATNLNPFLRELWAVKYGNTPAQIFIGRDGYRKVAQSQSDYDYHYADAVYANDTFTIKNGEIDHQYKLTDRGQLIGAYCVVKRKSSSRASYVFVDVTEYYQGNKKTDGTTKKKYNAQKREYYDMGETLWDTKPATMIKKVAEAQALRAAFQGLFAGTYEESEKWEEATPPHKTPQNSASYDTTSINEFWQTVCEKLEKASNEADLKEITITMQENSNSLTSLSTAELEKFRKNFKEKKEQIKNAKLAEPIEAEVVNPIQETTVITGAQKLKDLAAKKITKQ